MYIRDPFYSEYLDELRAERFITPSKPELPRSAPYRPSLVELNLDNPTVSLAHDRIKSAIDKIPTYKELVYENSLIRSQLASKLIPSDIKIHKRMQLDTNDIYIKNLREEFQSVLGFMPNDVDTIGARVNNRPYYISQEDIYDNIAAIVDSSIVQGILFLLFIIVVCFIALVIGKYSLQLFKKLMIELRNHP